MLIVRVTSFLVLVVFIFYLPLSLATSDPGGYRDDRQAENADKCFSDPSCSAKVRQRLAEWDRKSNEWETKHPVLNTVFNLFRYAFIGFVVWGVGWIVYQTIRKD